MIIAGGCRGSRVVSLNIHYINLDEICATRLDNEGKDVVTAKYYTPPGDGTHTNPAGAMLNAESVVMGIRALKDLKRNDYLSEEGKKLEPANEKFVRKPGVGTASATGVVGKSVKVRVPGVCVRLAFLKVEWLV